jgi:hypothetical protein
VPPICSIKALFPWNRAFLVIAVPFGIRGPWRPSHCVAFVQKMWEGAPSLEALKCQAKYQGTRYRAIKKQFSE